MLSKSNHVVSFKCRSFDRERYLPDELKRSLATCCKKHITSKKIILKAYWNNLFPVIIPDVSLQFRKSEQQLNHQESYLLLRSLSSQVSLDGSLLKTSLKFLWNILEFLLFADDTNVFVLGVDVDELYSIMNNELLKVTNWCNANVLSINAKKSVYILFHRARKKLLIDHSLIGDSILVRADTCKFLGTFVDRHLTFKPHIQYLTHKISRNIRIISHIHHYITSSIAITLYYSFT